jgi:hypothetical protein
MIYILRKSLDAFKTKEPFQKISVPSTKTFTQQTFPTKKPTIVKDKTIWILLAVLTPIL